MNIIEFRIDSNPRKGTIIDIESTHWDSKRGEMITAGFASGNQIKILQRVDLPESKFRKVVIKELEKVERPMYAFHKEIEEDFLRTPIENELQQNEEAAFGALVNEGLLDRYNSLCDPLFNEEIPLFWEVWKKTRNKIFLSKIVRHNYCCLAKECYLKLKRVDAIDLPEIAVFPSSAQIEKRYIRPQLGISEFEK